MSEFFAAINNMNIIIKQIKLNIIDFAWNLYDSL